MIPNDDDDDVYFGINKLFFVVIFVKIIAIMIFLDVLYDHIKTHIQIKDLLR
jgi:hypothetical protein